MAKLPRKTQKIFCGNPTSENQTSVFGTMKTDNKQYSTDVGTLQSNEAYEQGWKSATIASYKPFMEDFNTLNYINTSQLAYLFQQGIPEWDGATTYYKNSFCSYNGDLWKSLIDNNLNNTPIEGESWTLFTSGSKGDSSGLELCDIGLALYVDESKGLRRYLNGQIVDINTNTQAFLTRLQQIITSYPNLACTETEWQSTKTLSKLGQVGKFVLNYNDEGTTVTSVRLPLVKNINGLTDLANCGMTISESLPNITGGSGRCGANLSNPLIAGAFYQGTTTAGSGAASATTNMYNYIGFDASRSSSTYKDNAPVQQEAIQYPYFIQIATGQETQNDIINEIQLNNPYTLFDSKYVEAPLYNASWLNASDGAFHSGIVYVKAYEALVVENNVEIAVGTTVTLPSGTKYTKRGLSVKLSTAEDITDYDFVLNTENQTFRLPLLNGEEYKPDYTNGEVYTFPNTTTWKQVTRDSFVVAKGNDSYTESYFCYVSPDNGTTKYVVGYRYDDTNSNTEGTSFTFTVPKNWYFTIQAENSKSANIYPLIGNGTLYYYVGETVQNANLIDAGRLAEELVNKTNAEQAAHASMPSNKYVNLTLGASGTSYTAPADGWVFFEVSISTYSSSNITWLTVVSNALVFHSDAHHNNDMIRAFIPISKGNTFKATYNFYNVTNKVFRFIYANGAPST